MPVERAAPKVIKAWLDDVAVDLEMADAGIKLGNRLAISHLYYAAEKLVKAVRLHRGLVPIGEHRLRLLIDGQTHGTIKGLPEPDSWRSRLNELVWLSDYATSFRYPTGDGNRKAPPDGEKLRGCHGRIVALLAEARADLLS